jgi:hypothetical protein
MSERWRLRCAECERLAHDFRDAWHADQQDIHTRFRETADATRRDPTNFLLHWITSLARLTDDEFDSLQSANHPRVAEVRRRWKEHESHSGHTALADGWRAAFILDTAMHAGYGGLFKRCE